MTWPAAFRDLLSRGLTEVLLASTASGVVLPEHVRTASPVTVLQYGYGLPVPITDLDIMDNGIGATLSFGRFPSRTWVPWSAVFLIRLADESMGYAALPVGPDGALELVQVNPKEIVIVQGGPIPAETPTPARHLWSVPRTEGPEDDSTEEIPRGRPALKVVN